MAIIFTIFIIHAGLAMRKFPYKYREYKMLKTHSTALGHLDTTLWIVQAVSGFTMFFLGSAHLWVMLAQPQKIGPFASADRVYSDNFGFLYALLIFMVVLHAMIGLYRLSVKWGILVGDNPRVGRRRNKKLMIGAIAFFLLLAYSALGSYWEIGKAHKSDYGKRYTPQSISKEGGDS